MGWVSKWSLSSERRRHRILGWVFDYSHDRFKPPVGEIPISRVRDSSFITSVVFNLQGQKFKSPGSEIQISRIRDSNLQNQKFKSPGSEIQTPRVRDSNTYSAQATKRSEYNATRKRHFSGFRPALVGHPFGIHISPRPRHKKKRGRWVGPTLSDLIRPRTEANRATLQRTRNLSEAYFGRPWHSLGDKYILNDSVPICSIWLSSNRGLWPPQAPHLLGRGPL